MLNMVLCEKKRKKRKEEERKGKERKGKERKGKERKGKERKGKKRKDTQTAKNILYNNQRITGILHHKIDINVVL
jgi:hypothetical protein